MSGQQLETEETSKSPRKAEIRVKDPKGELPSAKVPDPLSLKLLGTDMLQQVTPSKKLMKMRRLPLNPPELPAAPGRLSIKDSVFTVPTLKPNKELSNGTPTTSQIINNPAILHVEDRGELQDLMMTCSRTRTRAAPPTPAPEAPDTSLPRMTSQQLV